MNFLSSFRSFFSQANMPYFKKGKVHRQIFVLYKYKELKKKNFKSSHFKLVSIIKTLQEILHILAITLRQIRMVEVSF